jgi:hypothetical protein
MVFQNTHDNYNQIIKAPYLNDLFLKNEYRQPTAILNNITMD